MLKSKEGVKIDKNVYENTKGKSFKDNQEEQMTLKEFLDYFHQDLNDPASLLMTIEETMRIIKEEHNTEINVSNKFK